MAIALKMRRGRLVSLSVLLLAIGMLVVVGGCGGDAQSTASNTEGVASSGGPPAPPLANRAEQPGPRSKPSDPTQAQWQPEKPSADSPYPGAPASNGAAGTSLFSGTAGYESGARSRPRQGAEPAKPESQPDAQPEPSGPPVEGFRVGNIAPEIVGEDIDGETFRLSDYRGKVVVVDFWGDW